MKKNFLIILACIFFSSNIAYTDEWDNFTEIDRVFDGQKPVTNKEFEEVMDALNSNQKKKDEKAQKKKIKKISGGGTSLHNELNPSKEITEIGKVKLDEYEGTLINLPVDIYIDNKILEKGFYKVIGKKEDDGAYLMFYQSQFFKGRIKVNTTDDDFGEETIDFAKIIPYNNSHIKIIYGSIDFNASIYVPFVQN